jgi:hypothetical protein
MAFEDAAKVFAGVALTLFDDRQDYGEAGRSRKFHPRGFTR